MAKWNESPSWTDFDNINSGQEFTHRLSPEALNALAENVAYLYQMPELGGKEDITVILDSEDEGEVTVAYSASKDIRLPASADGYWSRLSVIDNANFKSSNIKKGINLFGRIGTYDADGQAPNLYGIEVTPSKEYQNIVPESGYDGFDEVIVNPIPDEYIIPSGSLNITENKTVDVTKYASVIVAVPSETVEEWDGTGVVITPIGHEEPEENTFTFTVSDETYTAENDMNWYQWANSNYCNETSSCEGEESKVYIRTKTLILDLEGKAVIGGEAITKGGKYLSIIEQEDEGNTFTINGTSYQMDNRMTWYAWTRSDYNTDGFSCENENSYVYEAESKNVVTDAKGIEVLGTNYISEGSAYLIKKAVSLISFTMDGTSYQAEDGMTWAEWVASNYNTVNATIIGMNIYIQHRVVAISSAVLETDIIIANTAYALIETGSND